MVVFSSKYATFQQSQYSKKRFDNRLSRKFSILSRATTCSYDERRVILSDYDDEDSGIQSLYAKPTSASPFKSITHKTIKLVGTAEKTDWRSIFVASFLAFCGIFQSSLFHAGMWPFLQTIDNTATESFYGYIIASKSVGEIIASPILGHLSSRLLKNRYLLYTALCLMFAGNVLYFSLELFEPGSRKFLMLFARFTIGLGTSSTSLLQTYVVAASLPEDRSRAISGLVCGMALGSAIGPTLRMSLVVRMGKTYQIWHLRSCIYFTDIRFTS
ncbi:major facilitator superfamily domain-containing protein [Ditylenchus destructor]|uniref:Major facilitator superfamily domain-containing protein n=1 Tax=Ditylenchus destructor TaxID=166010 RepID=A0AAD4MSS0_9BILA|nr:major facilitator superfamily domain-containing protein [Ditylenchus destructor]